MKTTIRVHHVEVAPPSAAARRAIGDAVAAGTTDAYSYGLHYSGREWRRIARHLAERYGASAVEEILRSKHMRWASDRYGDRMTLEKWGRYERAERRAIDAFVAEL